MPASVEEVIGKVPLTPDCTRTRLIGARQSGCEGVTVGVGLEDSVVDVVGVPLRVCELLGVSVRVAVGVRLEESVVDSVAVPVRDSELLGVPLRVSELLGVDVREDELLGVPVELEVAEELRVLEEDPDVERVEAGVCVELEAAV